MLGILWAPWRNSEMSDCWDGAHQPTHPFSHWKQRVSNGDWGERGKENCWTETWMWEWQSLEISLRGSFIQSSWCEKTVTHRHPPSKRQEESLFCASYKIEPSSVIVFFFFSKKQFNESVISTWRFNDREVIHKSWSVYGIVCIH